ncbi:MAG: hypothetical protein AAB666_01575 [Patescibacteria group bacterium]
MTENIENSGDLALEQQREGLNLGLRNAIEANIPDGPMREELLSALQAAAKEVLDSHKSETPEVRQARDRFTDILEEMKKIMQEGKPLIDEEEVKEWQTDFDNNVKWEAQQVKEGKKERIAMSDFGRSFVRDIASGRLDPRRNGQFLNPQLWQNIVKFLKDYCDLQVIYPQYGTRFNTKTSRIVGTERSSHATRDLDDGAVVKIGMPGFKTASTDQLFEQAEIVIIG